MAQEPDLVISAGFSDAQLAKEADRIVALYRKRGEDAQRAFQDAQGRVTNTEAMRAHMRDLDSLAKKYDPVYRATRQYEGEVRNLDQALKVGAVTQAQYSQRLQEAQAKLTQAGKATADVAAKTGGGLRGNIQNLSFQVQDFAVQVANGTAASTALGQQLPQLLGGFGALGAVIGAVVAVGVPLAAAFLGAGDAAKELADSIDKLEKAQAAYDAAAKDSAATAADLAGKFGAATAQAQDLYDRIARLQYLNAVDAVSTGIEKLSENFDGLQAYLNVIDAELRDVGGGSPLLADYAKQIKDEFGLTVEQAKEFTRLLSDAQAAQSIQEKAAKLNEISVYLDGAVRSTADANAKMRELALSAAESTLHSHELAKSSEDLSLSMQEASDAASTVAASVAGIDFSNAVAGANQLVAALQAGMAAIASLEGQQAMATKRAQIARDYAGDKVGAAGALGAVDFNNSLGANPLNMPLTKEMVADLNTRREVYIEGEKELARIQEETQARLKAIADSSKGSGGGGGRKKSGGGARAAKEPVNILESADREIQQLERQIELLGKSNQEVAVAEARWAMLDAAKKAGIPVNDTLNAQIDQQAAQVGQLTAELEQAQLQQEQFDQAIEGIANAFSNAILEGENLRDSLASIFKQIAANILNAGIQQALTQAFSGAGGGGGWFSGLLSAAFGGTKAAVPSYDGGGFTGYGSRSGGIDGKGGELAILHPNETVLDHTRGQGGGAAGGSVDVRVAMDESGNLRAFIENVSGNVAARAVGSYDKSLPVRMQQVSANPRRRG